VLYLNPSEKYHIHWPMRRGRLNLHGGVGGSLVAVMSHLESIWAVAIQRYLDIPLRDLKVTLCQHLPEEDHIREMMDVLLSRLGFAACFVHLESVCATFGSGLSYACVVDVGDQKTSVSCVEDGISTRATRLVMEYGGADITHLFHYLLRKSGFPYKECDARKATDAILLQELKETMCHVNLVGDECLIAPLALFRPEMLGVTGPKQARVQSRNPGDPQDPHDDNYLIQTQARAREAAEGSQALDAASQLDDSQLGQGVLEDDDVAVPPEAAASTAAPRDCEGDLQCDQLLGIDQAIVQCVDRCDCDEMKRKMFSCVLVVGGGSLFPGIHTWLQNRLSVQIPIMYRAEHIDIITRPKASLEFPVALEMDPRVTTWKGASIMSCLDTAQELWVRQCEWQRFGVRLLRERAPFAWIVRDAIKYGVLITR
ncbi:hypothetical protein HPB47_019252, partial [Ixodes persulcatus]